MWPANTFETSVNLSDNDKRGNNCRIKEPKTLQCHNEKGICQFAQADFLSIQRVMTFFHALQYDNARRCDFFFGHFHEHWPLANSSVINAALWLKSLPPLS